MGKPIMPVPHTATVMGVMGVVVARAQAGKTEAVMGNNSVEVSDSAIMGAFCTSACQAACNGACLLINLCLILRLHRFLQSHHACTRPFFWR
jgi:hypothetical protein